MVLAYFLIQEFQLQIVQVIPSRMSLLWPLRFLDFPS